MLYVYFGEIEYENAPEQYIGHIDPAFDATYTDAWMDNWAKRVIEEVDRSKLLYPNVVDSPWLGVIPTTSISGGAKSLIMAKNISGVVFNGDNMGDNCFQLLLELSKTNNIMISLSYYPNFDWVDGVEVTIINSGKVVDNLRDFDTCHMMDTEFKVVGFNEVEWLLEIDKDAFRDEEFEKWAAEEVEQSTREEPKGVCGFVGGFISLKNT